jgi:lipopolysaccharide transport system ATP-binding protein
MSTSAISVTGLGKQYTLGNTVGGYSRLTEEISDTFARLLRKRPGERVEKTEKKIWALRGIDLEIAQGDVVGIVGRNGAGKSTFLKIMSRITEPTEGRAVIRGRISSLLEVGTGFHPELTGRENVYLNGAILGMRKREIDSRFDEIVGFAEVERFIDTPVKRYSSGMAVRLAFAVAAHLEPEILIVDEVLAVGDASFQRKCIGKMSEVASSGRTVLFVSHNMGAVSELCNRAMLLENGEKRVDGTVDEALDAYAHLVGETGHVRELAHDPSLPAAIHSIELSDADGQPTTTFDLDEDVLVRIRYEVRETLHGLQLSATVARNMVDVTQSFDTDALDEFPAREPGVYESVYRIPAMFLKAGSYTVRVTSGTPEQLLQDVQGALLFDIEELTVNAHARGYRRDRAGLVVSPGVWETSRIREAELLP